VARTRDPTNSDGNHDDCLHVQLIGLTVIGQPDKEGVRVTSSAVEFELFGNTVMDGGDDESCDIVDSNRAAHEFRVPVTPP
jgi:hypothetical protein